LEGEVAWVPGIRKGIERREVFGDVVGES